MLRPQYPAQATTIFLPWFMEFGMSFPLRLNLLLFLCVAATLAAVGGNLARAQIHSEDLPPIHFYDLSGYINGKGELIMLPRFEFAGDFDANGIAPRQGQWQLGRIRRPEWSDGVLRGGDLRDESPEERPERNRMTAQIRQTDLRGTGRGTKEQGKIAPT
jgi:hypothetical protein